MIPDETIDRIRESADIVQIIGEHVALRRMGTDFRGPCPFHQGTHRNFSVSVKKRIYYCFVCHEGGDVFTFLQKRLGLDWPSAVRMVAEKTGIEVREVAARREGPDPREPVWEANAAAAEYFERMLWDDDLGAPAREYLEGRQLGRDVARRFGLGFAPREIGLMRQQLQALGYDDDRLIEAGLLVHPDEGSEPRPRFRGRLIFPILDAMGRHVGFGGRVIGQGEPKYLNSPESPVFTKGKLLYGLNWARNSIRREDRALVVEGYFDVVRLAAAGIESVVAPMGTALTADQAALLTRYTKNVFLLYDSDKAGQRATFRSADELLQHRATVQVVTLPPGEDPDTFVSRNGAAAMEQQLGDAMDAFERRIQLLERGGWFTDLRRKRQALDRLLPTIRNTVDPLMRDLYLTRASEASGVAKEVLARELGELSPRRDPESGPRQPSRRDPRQGPGGGSSRDPRLAPGEMPHRDSPSGRYDGSRHRGGTGRGAFTSSARRDDSRYFEDPPIDGPPPPDDADWPAALDPREWARRGRDRRTGPGIRAIGAERELIRAMLHQRQQVEFLGEQIGAETFRDPRYRVIFAALVEHGGDAPLEAIAKALDAAAVAAMQALLDEPDAQVDPVRTIADSLAALRVRDLDEELAALSRDQDIASEEERDEIIRRKMALVSERRVILATRDRGPADARRQP